MLADKRRRCNDRSLCVEALHSAKIQLRSASRHRAGLPNVPAIFRSQDRAVASAGPGNARYDRIDATQAGGCVAIFNIYLGLYKPQQAHRCDSSARQLEPLPA